MKQNSQIPDFFMKSNNHENDTCPISAVHPDILHTHILTRLDGPTLAAVGGATSELHSLSSHNSLWRDICHRTWPSTAHPLLRRHITAFLSGHRSFYSLSSSTLCRRRPSSPFSCPPSSSTLISAVDIYFKNTHLLWKVIETGTESGSWSGSSFRVEALDLADCCPVPGKLNFDYVTCETALENYLTLSWILIEPNRYRAAILTSGVPVGVKRNWLTGEIEVRFGTVLFSERKGEVVECRVVVTCEGWVKEDLVIKKVSLEFEDLEENKLGWMDSLVILHEAMEGGEERKRGGERKGYDEFSEIKKKRKERKRLVERRGEVVEILTCFFIVLGFWVFVIFPIFLFVSHILLDK